MEDKIKDVIEQVENALILHGARAYYQTEWIEDLLNIARNAPSHPDKVDAIEGLDRVKDALAQCIAHLRQYGMIEDGPGKLTLLPPRMDSIEKQQEIPGLAEAVRALECHGNQDWDCSLNPLLDKVLEAAKRQVTAPVQLAPDWPEDFGQENGNYCNLCCQCDKQFKGNKHRRICKLCAPPAVSQDDKAGDENDDQ